MSDLTGNYDYGRLVREEKEHYSGIEVTDELKEGGVHAHDSWSYYWQGIARRVGESEFSNLPVYLNRVAVGTGKPIRVLSLGSGYCGHEIQIAEALQGPYSVSCTDINEEVFMPARQRAAERSLSLRFEVTDLNFIEIEPGEYDLILAHASLHHVINLERLFEQIVGGLSERGVFHLVEVLGMNRRLIWDENQRLANALLDALPDDITAGVRLDVPFETDGMEGVQQEDILPLIRQHFRTLFEVRHGAFMRFISLHPQLGSRLDPNDPLTRRMLDFLIETDACAVRNGVLRPLEIWGVYAPR